MMLPFRPRALGTAEHGTIQAIADGMSAFARLTAALAGVALLALAGCGSLDADGCSDIGNLSQAQGADRGCNGGLFSAKKQRDQTYDGDESPRLWTGEPPRKGPLIDTTDLNRPPAPKTGVPFVGYMGTLRVDYTPDPKVLGADVANLKTVGGVKFDADERTTLKFEKVSLEYFLKQVLGGALGVNYSAPEEVQGTVTFYTEQAIPKGQVLQVVRDVLSRNGYEMRFLNGVYQIARPEAMAALVQTAANGRNGEQVTRVIRIRKGSTGEIAAFVKQLVGDDISLASGNGGDTIILRAPPTEIDRVADLVQSLAEGGIGEDRVAIVPLHQSSPEKVAAELIEFYKDRLGTTAGEGVTILPLEHQQALLIGTRDARVMQGAKQLIEQLDREGGDEISLRVLPLVHLSADDVVQQLNAIFGKDSGSTPTSGKQTTQRETQSQSSRSTSNPSTSKATTDKTDTQDSNASTTTTTDSQNGTTDKSASRTTSTQPAAPVSATGDSLKIVSDPRNNAVMVYSTYSMFKRIRELLKAIDIAQSQVVIEATVAEVNITDDLEYGVQWYLQTHGLMAARSGLTAAPKALSGPGGQIHGTAAIGNVKLDVVMHALQTITKVKVISSPYLTVLDGKTARLVIGDQIPFATRTVNSTTTGTATVTTEVETKDTGIVLEVTPKIHSDNSVLLNVNQSVSKPQDSALTGNLTPVISTREVKSDILVDSGRTVLLGGLIQDRLDKTVNTIPVLGKLPVVGDLFGQKVDTSTRVELIVMITPRVIRHSSEIENITRLLRAQTHPR